MARRGSFGTVLSVGTPAKRAYAIRWFEGETRKKQSGFKTRGEASEALARVRVGLGDGTLAQKRRAGTAFALAATEWLTLHSFVMLRSHQLNVDNYRLHIEPFFKASSLAVVDTHRILEFRASLASKGLAPKTVNLIIQQLRAILRFAASKGHIVASPTDKMTGLMLPLEKTKLDPPIETLQDVGALLEAVRELGGESTAGRHRPDHHALFATLLYTGMRKGEACGLLWQHVDWQRRLITIRHSYEGQTKSGAHREVPMPTRLVEILQAHKKDDPWQGDVVFPNPDGEPYTENAKWQDTLREALKICGLPRIRIHDLRHTYAAHFLMSGGSIFDLSKNLGHHSVGFTDRIYGHLSAEHRLRQADFLDFTTRASEPAKVISIFDGKGSKGGDQ